MGPIVVQVWVQLPQENGAVTMVFILNSSWSHAYWRSLCIHLKILNVRYFLMAEATELKIMTSKSSAMV